MGEFSYVSTKEIMQANELRKEYKDTTLVKIYDEIISNNAELIRKISTDKYFDRYFAVYYYLLHNGYFSNNNKFIYSVPQNLEIMPFLGMNICEGHGVCRNIAPHFIDIMSKIKPQVKLFLIGTYLERRENKLNRSKFITENIEYKDYISRNERNKYRHLEVMRLEGKTPVLLDPTNFNIQRLIEQEPSKNKPLDLTCDLIFRRKLVNDKRINQEQEALIEASKEISTYQKYPAEKDYLEEIRDYAINTCLRNQSAINRCYEENKHLYNYMAKELVRRK